MTERAVIRAKRAEVLAEFNRTWDQFHDDGWTVDGRRSDAESWWFLAWRACEQQQKVSETNAN